jgi:branched-chain amino acid transport system ATP-binding protein
MTKIHFAAVGLAAGYGGIPVIRDVDLELRRGEVTVMLGANGAGKTTTLLALSGDLPLTEGRVEFRGATLTSCLWQRARSGMSYISEEHGVIRSLTVHENLRLALKKPLAALELFPELREHRHRKAGLLSGGQQKMLTLAMAIARKPDVLLADELSLGLAPQIVQRLLRVVRGAADGGSAVLLVEQHARQALAIGDQAIVMARGRIMLTDSAESVRANFAELSAAYLGRRS